jgi:hypothetical protein
MPTRFTHLNCKVETTFTELEGGALHEHVTLSVDASCPLTLALEESAGRSLNPANISKWKECPTRVRSTKYGFEIYNR